MTLEEINKIISLLMPEFYLELNDTVTRQRIAERLESVLAIPMKDVTTSKMIDNHGVAFEFEFDGKRYAWELIRNSVSFEELL